MNESLGLTSHNLSCNCTGCGMLRAGVCINCAEKAAALILESGPGEIAVEPCSGACREALQLYFSTPSRALARAASVLGSEISGPVFMFGSPCPAQPYAAHAPRVSFEEPLVD